VYARWMPQDASPETFGQPSATYPQPSATTAPATGIINAT